MTPEQRADLVGQVRHKLLNSYVLPNDDEVIRREEGRATELAEVLVTMIAGESTDPAPLSHQAKGKK